MDYERIYRKYFRQKIIESDNKNINEKLSERMRIIQAVSEIYTSVYYIDMSSGQFSEISSFDIVHNHIGNEGDAQERLNYFCRNMIMPDYTDEMLEFVDLSTLDERLRHNRIVSKQYISSIMSSENKEGHPGWNECCFIEGDRDFAGRLSHVIFATQNIHGAKCRELEAQKKLQETNDKLTSLLDA